MKYWYQELSMFFIVKQVNQEHEEKLGKAINFMSLYNMTQYLKESLKEKRQENIDISAKINEYQNQV